MANGKYSQFKNFKFVGYISFKQENLVKSKDGSTWRQIGFSVTDGNNSQFVISNEFGAGSTFKVKVVNEDGGYDNKDIYWNERNKEEVLKEVASFNKKYVLGKTVLHQHDFNEEILRAVNEGKIRSAKFEDGKIVSGTKVAVSGQVKLNYYNGNISQQYEITRFNMVKDEVPCEFSGSMSLVFTKGAVKDDVKNNRLVVNGYMAEYNKTLFGEKTPTGLLPQTFVLNYSEVKNGEKLRNFLLTKMDVEKGKYFGMCFDVDFMRGAKETEAKDVKFTREQRELIELGLMTEEEVMASMTVVGKKITETQIKKINISGAFAKVVVKTDYTVNNVFKEETEDDLYEEENDDDDIFSNVELPFDEADLPF